MRRTICLLSAWLALSLAHAAADPSKDPRGWLHELDAAKPKPDGWKVEAMRVELGPAHLDVESGWLVPVAGPAPRLQEFLFLGRAKFVLEPADPVESYQLGLFTAHPALDEPVTKAVVVLGDDAIVDAIASRPGAAPVDAPVAKEAAALLAAWRGSREYLRSGVRFDALADAAADRPAQRFVATWCDAPRLGRFFLDVSPFREDPITVRHFVPFRLGDEDKESWQKWIRREQEQGRRLDTDVEDLGDWDTWYASGFAVAGGTAYGHRSFEPEHYDLTLDIDDGPESVAGTAKIELVSRADGARILHLSLLSDLEIDAVALAGGAALPWVRSGYGVAAVLPEPVAAGGKLAVEVKYHGVLFVKTRDKLLVKRTTQYWYPHAGTLDRATYKATIDSPDSWTVLASGKKLSDVAAGGRRRQIRELDKPSGFFGFEIGKYRLMQQQLGHVALEIGFLTDLRTASQADRDRTIATIGDALQVYEDRFGPYPMDTLTIAGTRYDFAQGFLGFVTLPDKLVQGIDLGGEDALDHSGTIAHELAHQWWGDLVGWSRDSDVWLSESLADYCATIYRRTAAEKSGEQMTDARLGFDNSTGVLASSSLADRPLEATGPISLGSRLRSSLSDGAYQVIVYQKGAMVLALLSEELGEQQLLAMLKEIAQRASFRSLDTDTVLAALAKMSGRDLKPFAEEFIRGVGYPEIHYDYAIEPAEGGFAIRGRIHQVAHGFRQDQLVRVGASGFDIQPTFHEYQPVATAHASLAAIVSVSESSAEGGRQMRGFRTTVQATGEESPIALKVAKQPTALHLDPRNAMPATVVNATLEPKRSLTCRAAAAASTGRADDAKALYEQALAAPMPSGAIGDAPSRKQEVQWFNDRINGQIHLALAELALDGGQTEPASAALGDRTVGIAADRDSVKDLHLWFGAGAEDPANFPSVHRDVLKARLALRAGDAATAFKLLKGVLALNVLQSENDTVFDSARKNRLGEGTIGTGGDYLLYAIAAHASGHEDICKEAAAEAQRHGADASLLAGAR